MKYLLSILLALSASAGPTDCNNLIKPLFDCNGIDSETGLELRVCLVKNDSAYTVGLESLSSNFSKSLSIFSRVYTPEIGKVRFRSNSGVYTIMAQRWSPFDILGCNYKMSLIFDKNEKTVKGLYRYSNDDELLVNLICE